jgi:hypothetical protein
MNCLKVLAPLLSRGIWPCLVAGWWLAHAPVQAQGTSGNTASSGPAVTATAPDVATGAPGTDPVAPSTAPSTSPAVTSIAKSPAPPHKAPAQRDTRPTWAELSHDQQQALRPLAQAWPSLSELHKRKWLVLSQNFVEFSPQEQHKLQQRMSDWASLTARERAQARLHFAEVQQLPGDERRAKWEAYQALSDEQRRKLADDILLEPPRGAAVASRPVAPSKLTQPPAPKPDQVLQPRIDTDQVHPKTLLPHFLQGTSTR